MNKQEINEFIEKMEEVGDVWTEEQVNDVMVLFKSSCRTCISRIEFIILELSVNNKLNNEYEVKNQ